MEALDGVQVIVRLPSGAEAKFVLPLGATVDQVKRAIFEGIPQLNHELPNDYALGMEKSMLNVEYAKLRSMPSVVEAVEKKVPVEFEVLAKKPEVRYGLVKGGAPTATTAPQSPRGNTSASYRIPSTTTMARTPSATSSSSTTTTNVSTPSAVPSSPRNTRPSATTTTTPSTTTTFNKPTTTTTTTTSNPSAESRLAIGIRMIQQRLSDTNNNTSADRIFLTSLLSALQNGTESSSTPAPKTRSLTTTKSVSERSLKSAFMESKGSTNAPSSPMRTPPSPKNPPSASPGWKKTDNPDDVSSKPSINRVAKPRSVTGPEQVTTVPASGSPDRAQLLQQEFIETEEKYVGALRQLVNEFLKPLQNENPPILSPEVIDTIFSKELNSLLLMHEQLLSNITSKDKPFTEGLLFFVPFLKIYTAYINNHSEASRALAESLASSKKFYTFVNERASQQASRLDLSSYLIMPVQRLPRYELLLRDLVKYTADEKANKQLTEILEKVKEVNSHVNESRRRHENTDKLSSIQKRITGAKKGQVSLFDKNHRVFIREGPVQLWLQSKDDDVSSPPETDEATNNEDKERLKRAKFENHYFFLFDDILINTKLRSGKGEKCKFQASYSLENITSIKLIEDEGEKLAVVKSSKDHTTLMLKVPDIDVWVADITKYSEQSKTNAESASSGRPVVIEGTP